ncbi:MAG TPA: YbaK/prolyl-tRNA synthetase associated domain-containing protein [Burkholderiaceae bacterium]|nr:YbaK/prolyl-tRNA synthetase associated domain-containing protein [Burkholderiaceae bacterium]
MADVFERLTQLLRSRNARFRVIEHPAEGRSDLVAAIRGTVPGQGAKAMLCRSKDDSGQFVLAVLPGDRKLDFRKVAIAAGMRKATLASPEEVLQRTECVVGAVPPFSLSADIRLVVDPALVESHEEIAFNAGRLDRSIVLDSRDYVRIAEPLLQSLSI